MPTCIQLWWCRVIDTVGRVCTILLLYSSWAQKYSSWLLNTNTFIAPNWRFCRGKQQNCIIAVFSKVRSWDLEGIQWILWIYTDAALGYADSEDRTPCFGLCAPRWHLAVVTGTSEITFRHISQASMTHAAIKEGRESWRNREPRLLLLNKPICFYGRVMEAQKSL